MSAVKILANYPEEDYHRSRALSSSGARRLLPPSCPAKFRYERDNPPAPKKEFDYGHAAHKKVLGVGLEIVECKFANWMTKAAKEKAAEVRARGGVPLLTKDVKQVDAMALALSRHSWASALFKNGEPEVSIWHRNTEFEVDCRARLDWMPNNHPDRVIIPDYKSTVSANPHDIDRAVYNYGYHQQGEWYIEAMRAAGWAGPDAAFVLVCQEKTPPYIVTVAEIQGDALKLGRERNKRAMEVFAKCNMSGIWPGYTDEVVAVNLPNWAYRDED